MVRHYKSKGTRKKYSDETLKNAIVLINEGQSLRSVADQLNIEKMFLVRYMKKLNNPNSSNKLPGHQLALSKDAELLLADHLRVMANNGFALSKNEVLDVVKEYVEQNNLTVPFSQNRPGHDWYKGFCARHKMSLKNIEPLEKARKVNTSDPFLIYQFYDLLEQCIRDLGIEDKPQCIYNLDETSFCNDPSRVKLISGIGQKSHRTQEGTGRDNTSVLACCNAAGLVLPPLIIFQGANLWSNWKAEKDLPGTYYACSQRGWMTSEVFHDYFRNFCQVVKERPLLLIFDGHMTHLDVATAEYARQNNVTIIKLPAHTSDVLQPLDKACFKTLKYTWDKNVIRWYRENQRKLQKGEFANLLCEIWNIGLTSENVKAGFESVGIHPFDRTKYPVSRLDPIKLARYNEYKEKASDRPEEVGMEPTEQVHDYRPNPTPSRPISDKAPNVGLHPVGLNDGSSTSGLNDRPSTSGLNERLSTNGLNDRPSTSESASSSARNSSPTFGNASLSFEDLLLQKIRSTLPPQKKRKRVDAHAKVITSEEWIEAERIKQDEERAKETKKNEAAKKRSETKKKKKTSSSKKNIGLNKKDKETFDCHKHFGLQNRPTYTGREKDRPTFDSYENKNSEEVDDPDPVALSPKNETANDKENDSIVDLQVLSDSSLEDFLMGIKQEAVQPIDYETPIYKENIKKDTFVLVDIKGGSRNATHFKFVCQINEVDDEEGDITVQGLRSCDDVYTEFAYKDKDIFTVDFMDIIAVLPYPSAVYKNNKITYKFHGSVGVKEH